MSKKKHIKQFYIFNFLLLLTAVSLFLMAYTKHFINFSFVDILIFLLLAVFSDFFSVNLPKYGNVTVTFAIDLAAILLFGPFAASLIGGLSTLLTDLLDSNRKIYKILFNLSQITITINLAALAYKLFGGHFGNVEANSIISILFAALVYSQINLTLFALGFSFLEGISFKEIWLTNLKSVHGNFLALIPLGVVIAYLYKNIGIVSVGFVFVPLIVARHTFKLYMNMREMYLDTIKSLAATIDAKDKYTLGHSDRVAQYSIAIAKEMKLQEEEIENLKYIGLLHDIGKIAVPESILNKPSKLSENEYSIMKYHAEYGAEIVKKIKFLKGYEIIRAHHERVDGTGYPDKLVGEEIPIAARIIAVADSFDAMTSDRPYRSALSVEKAFTELEFYSDKQFDRRVVEAFKRMYPKINIQFTDDEFILPEELRQKLHCVSGGETVAL